MSISHGSGDGGGWPTFAPPRTRLPHPSRFSKGEHLRPRHHGHASHTNSRVPCYLSACPTVSIATTELYTCTLPPPVVTNGAPAWHPADSPPISTSSAIFPILA